MMCELHLSENCEEAPYRLVLRTRAAGKCFLGEARLKTWFPGESRILERREGKGQKREQGQCDRGAARGEDQQFEKREVRRLPLLSHPFPEDGSSQH